jgi:hypothetical protein
LATTYSKKEQQQVAKDNAEFLDQMDEGDLEEL